MADRGGQVYGKREPRERPTESEASLRQPKLNQPMGRTLDEAQHSRAKVNAEAECSRGRYATSAHAGRCVRSRGGALLESSELVPACCALLVVLYFRQPIEPSEPHWPWRSYSERISGETLRICLRCLRSIRA